MVEAHVFGVPIEHTSDRVLELHSREQRTTYLANGQLFLRTVMHCLESGDCNVHVELSWRLVDRVRRCNIVGESLRWHVVSRDVEHRCVNARAVLSWRAWERMSCVSMCLVVCTVQYRYAMVRECESDGTEVAIVSL